MTRATAKQRRERRPAGQGSPPAVEAAPVVRTELARPHPPPDWIEAHKKGIPSNPAPHSRLTLAWVHPAMNTPPAPHEAAFQRGYRHALKMEYKSAFGAFRAAIDLKPDFAEAYSALGWIVAEGGRFRKAVDIYDDLLARFDKARTSSPQKELVANALINKGVSLSELDRNAEAIAVYNDFLTSFDKASALLPQEWCGAVLFNKGVALGRLGRSEDAIAAYNDLLTRFDTTAELSLRELVAKALFNKGFRLRALGRKDEAYDAALKALQFEQDDGNRARIAVLIEDLLDIRKWINDGDIQKQDKYNRNDLSKTGALSGTMNESARAIFKPAADLLGLPVEVLWEAGQKARAEAEAAARVMTQRVEAEPRAEVAAPDFAAASAQDTTASTRKARRGSSVLVERTRSGTSTLIERKLPPPRKGLEWPTEHFEGSREFRKHAKNGGGIVNHLDRVWRKHIEARAVDMSVLRTFYPSTAQAVDAYRTNQGHPRELPPDLDIPRVSPGAGRRRAAPLTQATAA